MVVVFIGTDNRVDRIFELGGRVDVPLCGEVAHIFASAGGSTDAFPATESQIVGSYVGADAFFSAEMPLDVHTIN